MAQKTFLVCYSVTVGIPADSAEEAEELANQLLSSVTKGPDQDWNLEYIDEIVEG